MQPGRRIAFDYGDVRIGVALSDRDSILAAPLTTLPNSGSSLITQIGQLIAEYEPVALYVGEPLNLSGTSSASAEKTLAFADKLRTEFKLPVIMIDERLSTVSAASLLRKNGINAKDARSKIDMQAAVAILEQAIALEKASDV